MSINLLIRNALLPFGDPVEFEIYTGEADTYYVFNYTSLGADDADDQPGHERYLIQVHFICPPGYDPVPRIKKTKQALFKARFTWPALENASEQDARHYIFECETSEGVDVDGES